MTDSHAIPFEGSKVTHIRQWFSSLAIHGLRFLRMVKVQTLNSKCVDIYKTQSSWTGQTLSVKSRFKRMNKCTDSCLLPFAKCLNFSGNVVCTNLTNFSHLKKGNTVSVSSLSRYQPGKRVPVSMFIHLYITCNSKWS